MDVRVLLADGGVFAVAGRNVLLCVGLPCDLRGFEPVRREPAQGADHHAADALRGGGDGQGGGTRLSAVHQRAGRVEERPDRFGGGGCGDGEFPLSGSRPQSVRRDDESGVYRRAPAVGTFAGGCAAHLPLAAGGDRLSDDRLGMRLDHAGGVSDDAALLLLPQPAADRAAEGEFVALFVYRLGGGAGGDLLPVVVGMGA